MDFGRCKKVRRQRKWKWFFRKENPDQQPKLRIRTRTPARCSLLVAPELGAWLKNLRTEMIKTAKIAIKKAIIRKQKTTLPLTRWGLKLLKESKWIAIPNDKDGGYTLMEKSEYIEAVEKIRKKTMYEEINPSSMTRNGTEIHQSLVRKIANHERDQGLVMSLGKSTKTKDAKVEAELIITCKSHKPPGEVSFRNIHANPCYMYEGVATWVAHKISERFKEWETVHLINNSQQLVNEIKGMEVPENMFFVKLDIKDFYLCGSQHEIVDAALKDWVDELEPKHKIKKNERRKKIMEEALHFLLHEQYVKTKSLPGRAWKAVQGTGQGLKHSGDVADISLYNLSERYWLTDATVQKKTMGS